MIKRAIVIGATSGIGLEVAKVLAAKGWQVGIAGRRENLLEQIKAEVPGVVAMERIDITTEYATEALERLILKMGGMELYFHSSGIGYQNPTLEFEKEVRTAETNNVGFTRMVNYAFHYFTKHQEVNGHIAVISSIAQTKGLGAAPAYSASKRYVSHYMECLTQLCAIRRIRNICLHDIRPGFVRTAILGDDNSYPLQLDPAEVALEIVNGIERNRSIITVDWKFRILVFIWRLVPRWLWVQLRISTK